MRVVVTGAGGNAGTSLIRALAADRTVTDVFGAARRRPGLHIPGVRWAEAEADVDPGHGDLAELFAGAEAVDDPLNRGVDMDAEDRPNERVRQLRDQAEELERAAQHAADPEERQRLRDRALRIREKSERENGRGSGTMDPM
ncbi:DUF6381 family protein [Streptomyces vinaceus]|uniref:DUF6381 family protein n=1 Tax=Streptomyces vinaceus TaxID=1960 RepID=UPI00381FDB4D